MGSSCVASHLHEALAYVIELVYHLAMPSVLLTDLKHAGTILTINEHIIILVHCNASENAPLSVSHGCFVGTPLPKTFSGHQRRRSSRGRQMGNRGMPGGSYHSFEKP